MFMVSGTGEEGDSRQRLAMLTGPVAGPGDLAGRRRAGHDQRVGRFLLDHKGRVIRRRIYPVLAVCVVMAMFGTTLVVASPALGDHPTLQGFYVLFCVFLLKLPLVGMLWWLIFRNSEWPTRPPVWDEEEVDDILAHILAEARRAADRSDELSRLGYLSGEAWHVADRATGAQKVDALTVALRIDDRRASLSRRRFAAESD